MWGNYHVAVVTVEGDPVDQGPVGEVLHDDRVESFLLDQGQQRGAQGQPGALGAHVRRLGIVRHKPPLCCKCYSFAGR